jgi:hypothetical protein
MTNIPYAFAIGSIMYVMLCIRLNVSYALNATSRYKSNLSKDHWIAVTNILKYLRITKDALLVYGGHDELVVIGYIYASFQIDHDDFKSQSCDVLCLNSGAISWKRSKSRKKLLIILQRLAILQHLMLQKL